MCNRAVGFSNLPLFLICQIRSDILLISSCSANAFDFLICFGALVDFFGCDDVVEVCAKIGEDVGTGGVVGAVLNFVGVVGDVE